MQVRCFLILTALFFGLAGCRTIKPGLPLLKAEQVYPVALPPSKIDIPISIDLSKTLAQLNDSIPKALFSDNWPLMQSSGDCQVEYKWRFKRTPLDISFSGPNMNVFSTGYYATAARVRPCCASVCPWLAVACGNDENGVSESTAGKSYADSLAKIRPQSTAFVFDSARAVGLFIDTLMPTAQIKLGLTCHINVARNYQLITQTTLSKFEPVNRCRVTFLRIDITDKILDKARPPIARALAEFDRKISQYNLRAELDSVWRKLFSPLQADTLGYILMNPEEVRLSPLHGDGNKIGFTVGLTARPVFSFENPGNVAPVPLPDISEDEPGNAFMIYMDAKLQYSVLSGFLNETLKSAGKIAINKKGYVALANAQIIGTGNAQLLIKINFSGKVNGTAYKGWMYLTGMPTYNPLTGQLALSDLDFTIETKNLLLHSGDWMLHSKIKEILKSKTRWSVVSAINTLQNGLNEALNKNVGPDLKLQGNIDHLDIAGILPLQQYLLLRATAHGNVKAEVLR